MFWKQRILYKAELRNNVIDISRKSSCVKIVSINSTESSKTVTMLGYSKILNVNQNKIFIAARGIKTGTADKRGLLIFQSNQLKRKLNAFKI